jgi:hypothetical protein
MLTITVREIIPEQRWILYGRLTDYSVAEVLSNWCLSKDRESAGYRVIDLDGVSVIDRSGQRVLSMNSSIFEVVRFHTATLNP